MLFSIVFHDFCVSITRSIERLHDFLDPRPWPEWCHELGCPSILPSFCPSVWKFSWDWLISFFLELSIVLGAHVVLCMTELDVFKKFAVFLHKPKIWEKSSLSDMDQNALGQSDCRIFKSTIYLEQNDEKARFLAF